MLQVLIKHIYTTIGSNTVPCCNTKLHTNCHKLKFYIIVIGVWRIKRVKKLKREDLK